tara:strand:+ start:327 stop:539 length:213 start_codon:yes stop_codon:yes gene_type:complete
MAKKKKRSLLSKVFNNKLMRGLTIYELSDLMASPASDSMGKLLGMQEGGQIKKKRTKKKPKGWGKARYGK